MVTEQRSLCFCAIMSAMDKLLAFLCVISVILIVAMMFLTSPSSAGVLGILVFLAACYVLFSGLAVLGCRLFFWFRGRLNRAKAVNVKKMSYRYGFVIAFAPLVLLVANSFGGVSIWEVGLTSVLEFLLCFLVAHDIL